MTTVHDSLADQLGRDFAHACYELTRARLQLSTRDDRRNREALALRRAEADAVLDMYLESARQSAPDTASAAAS
jgi:hypothetical protein